MRLLIPTKNICLPLSMLVISGLVGKSLWDSQNMRPDGDNVLSISATATIFLIFLGLGFKCIRASPIFTVHKERQTYEIFVGTGLPILIGPIHNIGGNFLLLDMIFKAPPRQKATMHSFRLAQPVKNHYHKLDCLVEIYVNNSAKEKHTVTSAEIDWELYEECALVSGEATYSLELPVPETTETACYLNISPLALTRLSNADDIDTEEKINVELILRIGIGSNKLFRTANLSLKNALICEAN